MNNKWFFKINFAIIAVGSPVISFKWIKSISLLLTLLIVNLIV